MSMRTTGHAADSLEVDELAQVIEASGVLALQQRASRIAVDEEVLSYAVNLVRETRTRPGILQGAGPRASMALIRTARAGAMLDQRDFVVPDDVKAVARPVLRHRIQLSPEREIDGASADSLLDELLADVPAPRR